MQRAVVGARHLLIEVAFRRLGQALEPSPSLTVEPARVEVERGVERLLLRPHHPQPALRVERERRTPHVPAHSGHRVPRAPDPRRRIAARETQLVAPARVARVHHPDVVAVGGIGDDGREVVGPGVVAHPDHVVESRVGFGRRLRRARVEAERGELGHRRVEVVELEPRWRVDPHATRRVLMRGGPGVAARALEQRVAFRLRAPRSRARQPLAPSRDRQRPRRAPAERSRSRAAASGSPGSKTGRSATAPTASATARPATTPARGAPSHSFATYTA